VAIAPDCIVVRFVCTDDVGVKIKLLHIPGGVVEHKESELVESSRASRRRPSQFASRLEALAEADPTRKLRLLDAFVVCRQQNC
jgi:hypothetical protein